jgi:DNA-binding MarR family transcriptional regulator
MSSRDANSADLEILLEGHPPSEKGELRLWLRMLSATNLVSREIRRRLRQEFGVTLPQFDLLAQLAREPAGLRLGQLSQRMMVTNGNVTGLVDRLEADGLVERGSAHGDARVTVAKLTPEGEAFFQRMATVHEGWVRELMGGVDQQTSRQLFQNLGRIKQSVVAHSSTDKLAAD